MDEAIKITGLREVQKRLYSYSQQLGDRVVVLALQRGANIVKGEIQSRVPVRKGRLRRGFKVAKSRIHSGKGSGDMLGVYLKLKTGKRDPFYGRFINDGWNSRGKRLGWVAAKGSVKTNRHGRVTTSGRDIPGRHFVQRGWRYSRHAAVLEIVRAVKAGADILARKVGF